MEQSLYDHYYNPGTGHRQDLESAIAIVSIVAPSHGKTPEFKVVQYPNNTIYDDPADGSGVAIGSYAETAPEVAQILALPTSTFTAQGYTNNLMFSKLRRILMTLPALCRPGILQSCTEQKAQVL
ncbi:MAG: hypothetical protein A2Y57_02105 [Candidatus Woykebacteria bacterium RBG_13_40_7b]|uniref:Uncharacterized protein n=1 Tax=Candidatus Woykebacteria bacterium RBG_13_40_7b TaxID=1802594 RepID=A0A1G1W9S7_9BACT|nr:MAG: hypothetical protein A2Y57_02105 [Candidatus Woykebacteria bacterium RBG_13_40_7b]